MEKAPSKKIKKLEYNMKITAETPQKAPKPSKKEIETKISFDLWFQDKLDNRILRLHHKELLKKFFERKGLKKIEKPEIFDKVFKKY